MHSDNEIVVSHKNDTFYEYTVAKPWKHYANLKKPDANSTYCMIQFIWNVPKRQINRDHPGLEKIGEMGKVTTNRYRIWGGGWWKYSKISFDNSCTTLWIYQKPIHFKWVNFMVYKFYINKAIKKQYALYENISPFFIERERKK